MIGGPAAALAAGEVKRRPGTKIKLALNSYTFKRQLMAGQMSLDDVIDYCAAHNIDGVDLTGCYCPGYPKVPGVRNDFTVVDPLACKGSGVIIGVQHQKIIDKVGFRGFLPIEALGQGDPAVIVTAFFEKVRRAMS